jgi:hypothetical protein
MPTRKTISSLALVAAMLAAMGACGSKKDEAKGKGPGTGGAAAKPASNDLRAALAMIPVDADGVVGIDLAQLRTSKLGAGYQDRVVDAAGGSLAAFKTACGFDPMQKVEHLVVGGKGKKGEEDMVAVLRGMPKAELMACADKVSKDPKIAPELTLTVDGDYVVATAEGKSVALQFANDTTLVAARKGGAAAPKADLAAIIASADGAGVTGSANFMQLIDAVNTDASVWFVISGKADRVKGLTRGLLTFDVAIGDATITDGLVLDIGARLESPQAAEGMAASFGKTLESMKKSLLKNVATDVTVKSDGPFVRLHAKMTKQQLEELGAFAGSLIGSNPFE